MMHGSDQLRAHAKAAVTLSEARMFLERVSKLVDEGIGVNSSSLEDAEIAYAAAKAAEYTARLAYTNPFGVEK